MRTLALGFATLLAFGCGGGSSSSDTPDAAVAHADGGSPDAAVDAGTPDSGIDPVGTHFTYVIDRVTLPATTDEADAFGFDLDGDEQIDNRLGTVIAVLSGQGFDAQGNMTSMMDRGDIIYLADVQATGLTDAAGTGFSVYLGENPSTPPCTDALDTVCRHHFDGATTFDVSPDSPRGKLAGAIVSSHLTGGPGGLPMLIPISLTTPPIPLNLIGARVGVTVAEDGLTQGRLGGAVTEDDVNNVLIPGIHDALADVVARDCPGGTCVPGSDGETLVNLFDTNGDGKVTLEELQSSILVQNLLAPDLDLFDESGNFNPRVDGVKDSLSLGVTFSAVGAVFLPPAG